MAEGVEIYELFDFGGQSQQSRVHDIRKKPSQGLHVVTGFAWGSGRHPFVFCCFDKIVNFGVNDLENAFFSGFFIAPELFSCHKSNRCARGVLRPRSRKKQFELMTSRLEVLQIDKNLNNLPQVLRGKTLD